MRNAHCRTWNMARKLKNIEIEKYTFLDVKYGKENEEGGKFRSVHCRIWNMERNQKSWKIRNIHLTT